MKLYNTWDLTSSFHNTTCELAQHRGLESQTLCDLLHFSSQGQHVHRMMPNELIIMYLYNIRSEKTDETQMLQMWQQYSTIICGNIYFYIQKKIKKKCMQAVIKPKDNYAEDRLEQNRDIWIPIRSCNSLRDFSEPRWSEMNLSPPPTTDWDAAATHVRVWTWIIPLIPVLRGHSLWGRVDGDVRLWEGGGESTLTRMGDREAVGRLEVVDVVVEVERLLRGVLVGVVELDGEPERAVLLHRGTHEQSPFEEMENQQIRTVCGARSYTLCVLLWHMEKKRGWLLFERTTVMQFIYFFKPVRQCVTLQIERGGGGEREGNWPSSLWNTPLIFGQW